MLAAVERLAIREGFGHGIGGLDRVVSVDPGLRAGRAQQPVAMEKVAVAEVSTDLPAVDDLFTGEEILLDLFFARFHAFNYGGLLLGRERFEVESLPCPDAKASEL